MDALKRAEKARQAQAEKTSDGEGMSSSKLELDPIEVEAPDSGSQEALPSEPPSASPAPESLDDGPGERAPPEPSSPAAPGPSTTHFSLTDNFPATEKVPPPAPSGGGPPEPPGGGGEGEKLGPFSLMRDDELSLEDTGELLPVVREAEKSLNRYFDEPADSAATTTAGPEVTVGDEDSTVLGGRGARKSDSQAKRAAESVFKAKGPAVARYQRNRTLIIALPLVLLGVIAIGLLFFWDSLERAVFGPPPVLVQRPPQATEIPPPPQAAAPVEPSKLAAAAEAASAGQRPAAQAQDRETTGSSGTATKPSTPVLNGAAGPGNAETVAAAPVATAVAANPAGIGLEHVTEKATSAATQQKQPALTQPPPASVGRHFAGASVAGVRISRRSKPDGVHAGIHEAYLAFQRGDDAVARALYAEVNRRHPNNRNALLGLGAIAVRGGHYSEAIGHYARVLSINPRDPVAGAALINLNQRVPAGEGEGHIKRLLGEESENPFLYFTLGNVYARQGRWMEAQQAYFDAYRRDSKNADFAFNLAVSLDRLGQAATALTYYQRALNLASEGPASFKYKDAQMRIERLTAGGQG